MLSSQPAELVDHRARAGSCDRAQNSSTASGSASGEKLVLDLATDAKQLAGGDEHPEVRTRLGKRGKLRCCLDHLLEVVEQQEKLTFADVLHAGRPSHQASALSLQDKRRVVHGGEPHPEDPGPELADELGRPPRSPVASSRAARTGQRHEPSAVAQQSGRLRPTSRSRPTNERHRPRQVGVRDRLQRREALVSELEERHRIARSPSADARRGRDTTNPPRNSWVTCESTTWPPCAALIIRAARWTSCPTYFGGSSMRLPGVQPHAHLDPPGRRDQPAHLVRRRRPPRRVGEPTKKASPS